MTNQLHSRDLAAIVYALAALVEAEEMRVRALYRSDYPALVFDWRALRELGDRLHEMKAELVAKE